MIMGNFFYYQTVFPTISSYSLFLQYIFNACETYSDESKMAAHMKGP